jgi:Tetratricopeptide repeat
MSNDLLELSKKIEDKLKDKQYKAAHELADKLRAKNSSAGLAYKGLIYLKEGNFDEAEDVLLESYQINSKQHLALANLIPVYLKKKDSKKALAYGEQAYKLFPDNQSIYVNYAAALLNEQRHKEAIEILEKHLDETNPNMSVLSGLISGYRGVFDQKRVEYLGNLASKFFADNHDFIRLNADSLAERSPQDALKEFQRALEKDPGNICTKWNMSLVQLRLGMFEEGWKNYDFGLFDEVGKIGRPIPKLFCGISRVLDPNQLDREKWTVAVCEQGIGDQVLFFGCFHKFIEDFPKTIVIAEARFAPILQRSFPGIAIYIYGTGPLFMRNHSLINGYIPIGSIQKKYRSTEEKFLNHRTSYLIPDQKKVERYRSILKAKTNNARIIGISWKGGYWERAQVTKTLPLEHWDPILSDQRNIYVSLQYGDISSDKRYLTQKYRNLRFIDGIDFKKELDNWFALICACDQIISVSTAAVHFAGAAGKCVDLLLSDKGAPFIWGLEHSESIAYEKIRIHRKNKNESMETYFSNVAQKVLV